MIDLPAKFAFYYFNFYEMSQKHRFYHTQNIFLQAP